MKHILTLLLVLFHFINFAQTSDLNIENDKLKVVTFYENGNTKSISFYSGKKLESITSVNLEEQIEKGKIKLDGPRKTFYNSGELKGECIYKKGESISDSCKNYMTNGELVYKITDTPPTFEGGSDMVLQMISEKVSASGSSYLGVIYVIFIVDKTGAIHEAEAFRGGDPESIKIAETIVEGLNGFKPGIHNGQAVNCFFNLPIRFE